MSFLQKLKEKWDRQDLRLAEQQRGYREKHLKRYKHIIAGYKANGCSICGYNKCANAIGFHHKNPTEKNTSIARLRYASAEKILEEIEKCIVICANCHAEIHSDRANKMRDNME